MAVRPRAACQSRFVAKKLKSRKTNQRFQRADSQVCLQEITVDTEVEQKRRKLYVAPVDPFSLGLLGSQERACFVGVMTLLPSGILNHSLFFVDLI